jgi:hypothetical protein
MSSSSEDGSDDEGIFQEDSDLEDEPLDSPDEDCNDSSMEESNDDLLNESDNSYDDINSIEHDYGLGDKRSRNRIGEPEKTSICLSDDAITQLITKCECTKARLSESCPNQHK